jgi:hypothetical protein
VTEARRGAFGLSIDPDELLPPERYPFGLTGGRAGRIEALARALASSPLWLPMENAILVARTEPPEGIAFLGSFTDQEASFLEWLPGQLEGVLPRFRYLSWSEVEAAVEVLATRLVERFGHHGVREMDYQGIPRGGLIVLGMLSYALGLKSDRIAGPGRDGRPVVVVDDCALTGFRFGAYLRDLPAARKEVIFAHLLSHADLRKAIREREPKVTGVLAAGDLSDTAPELEGEGLDAWRARWTDRTGEAAYWIGRPEHLGFPWSEPDLTFWDPRAEKEVAGWRIVPPEACLKNRSSAGGRPLRLQIQPHSRGSIRPEPRTFHGERSGHVLAANLETGRAIALGGVAADIWRALVRHGEVEPAVADLGNEYQVEPDRLRKDVHSLVGKLTNQRFLAGARRGSDAPVGRAPTGGGLPPAPTGGGLSPEDAASMPDSARQGVRRDP